MRTKAIRTDGAVITAVGIAVLADVRISWRGIDGVGHAVVVDIVVTRIALPIAVGIRAVGPRLRVRLRT